MVQKHFEASAAQRRVLESEVVTNVAAAILSKIYETIQAKEIHLFSSEHMPAVADEFFRKRKPDKETS
jgi:uncharacterized protein YfkK (UPF0435 family)